MTDNWGSPSPFGSPYQQGPYQQAPYQQAPYQQSPYQQAPYQQAPYQQPARPYAPPAPPAPVSIPEQRGTDEALDDLWSDSPWDDKDPQNDAEPARSNTTAPRRPPVQGTRRPQPAPPAEPEKRRPGAVSAMVLILVPLAAALATRGSGLVFTAGAVLGAFGAAALCSRRGVWWVSTGTPPVVLLMAVAGFVVRDSSASTGKFATSLAKVVAGAFPAMSAALAGAVLVGLVRLASARSARNPRRVARG